MQEHRQVSFHESEQTHDRIARHLFRLCLDEGRQLDEKRARMVVAQILADKRRHGLHVLAAFERLVRLHSESIHRSHRERGAAQ